MKRIDLQGQIFSRLTVKEFVGTTVDNRALWLCDCSCGNSASVTGKHLRNGMVKSCGCLHKEKMQNNEFAKSHGYAGKTRSPEYKTWRAMKARCLNKNNPAYTNYGGRGINICQEWQDSFEQFLEDMGTRPYNKTLDRINNDKGYYKENCRWATPKEQIENQRKRNL